MDNNHLARRIQEVFSPLRELRPDGRGAEHVDLEATIARAGKLRGERAMETIKQKQFVARFSEGMGYGVKASMVKAPGSATVR